MTEPPRDPYEFGWLDGPSRAAEDEGYLREKLREYRDELRDVQEREIADTHRELLDAMKRLTGESDES